MSDCIVSQLWIIQLQQFRILIKLANLNSTPTPPSSFKTRGIVIEEMAPLFSWTFWIIRPLFPELLTKEGSDIDFLTSTTPDIKLFLFDSRLLEKHRKEIFNSFFKLYKEFSNLRRKMQIFRRNSRQIKS